MNTPLVSVVMPAYRCGATIGAAIDSVLCQNVDLELLVIDDCSPESLEDALAPYRSDSRVRILKNERNMGAAQSRNRGVSLARGEYVAFLDSDDIWLPGKLAKQLLRMEETDMVLCATARELMSSEGELSGRVLPVKPVISYRELLKHNSIACSSVLMKRSVALEHPMHHEDSHEDYIMWLEILGQYGLACGINEPLLRYRLSNTGKSGSKLHSAKMTFKVYRYMGFSLLKSMICFMSYVLHGIAKYQFSRFIKGKSAASQDKTV